jgi:hypothetical protein
MSEHPAKTHPVAGVIAVLVLCGLLYLLVSLLSDGGRALIALPFLLFWGLFALLSIGWVRHSKDSSPTQH